MRHQCLVARRNLLVDRLELRVVRHDELAARVFDFHTDILPDLHRDGALLEVLIELPDGFLWKRRIVELVGVKGRAQRDVSAAGSHQGQGILDLRLEFLPIGKRVVHDQNIDQREVEPLEQCLKCGVRLKHVHMNVDGLERSKGFQSVFGAGVLARSRSDYGRRDQCGDNCNTED
jgi:hypothetical protein